MFTNVGGDGANQPLVDGLMEVVSNALTRLEQFHGRLTVAPASDIRKERRHERPRGRTVLAASLAITGSVQRIAPDEVQVMINLVDTRTIAQLRTETIRAKLTDLVALQDGVIDRVSRMLQLACSPRPQAS
jgi:TolB-like protein